MKAMKKVLLTALIAATPMMAQVKEKIEVPYIAFPIKMGKGFDVVQANCREDNRRSSGKEKSTR